MITLGIILLAILAIALITVWILPWNAQREISFKNFWLSGATSGGWSEFKLGAIAGVQPCPQLDTPGDFETVTLHTLFIVTVCLLWVRVSVSYLR